MVTAILVTGSTSFAQRTLRTVRGDQAGDEFGYSVARAGDVNADGYRDFVVGAPSDSGGYVRVFSGRDGSVIHSIVDSSRDFGFVVAGPGDLDQDGYDDVLANGGLGVQAFSGRTGTQLYVLSKGASVAGVGDLDADGHPDVAIGNPGADRVGGMRQPGRVVVHSGRTSGFLLRIYGEGPTERLGRSVSAAGDVNGDGHDDFLAGAPQAIVGGYSSVGRVRLFSGRNGALLRVFRGDQDYGDFGRSLAFAGDVDGDGSPDSIVAQPRYDHGSGRYGRVHVLSGADGSTIHVLSSGDPGAFGTSVSGVGDVDGDGFDDVLVGGRRNEGGSTARTAWIFSGLDGSLLVGQLASNAFGPALAGIGDVEGDGFVEWVWGAPWDGTQGVAAGAATLFSAAPLEVANLVAGQDATFGARNLDPSSPTVLAGSETGFSWTRFPALGLTLVLDAPLLVAGPRRSDPNGTVQWRLRVPPALQGRLLGFQAAHSRLSTTALFRVVQ